VRDQTLVSTASMLADAFGGLDVLSADPRIDPGRIGVMGFSKGAIAALYAAYRDVARAVAPAERRFALHVAYYPWCGLRLRRPVTTGAPVLIQTGALDDLVPPRRCADLIGASRGPQGEGSRGAAKAPDMRLVVLPGARHAFDHPLLAPFANLPLSAPSPAACELRQRADGSFVETHSGARVDGGNLKAALAPCSRQGHAGGNEAAAARAFANTLALLRAEGFLPRDSPAF
jgi:dienelactone hydrolase